MKILIFTDNHFCESSSIIREVGKSYSLRLENQIKTLNWIEESAVNNKCDSIICLGDFFDKPILTDQELTALKDIKWSNLSHYFIVGNHEASVNGLRYNSTKALERDNFYVIDKPFELSGFGYDILMLPYISESDRRPIDDYWKQVQKEMFYTQEFKHRIILSHNDVKGIQMGPIISKIGFDISDIRNNSSMFINGHIHNKSNFASNCYNLGNVTGQNFGEDASKYSHGVFILNTSTLELEFIENPYAFNFYKLEILSKKDLSQLNNLKDNSVLSIKCTEELISLVKESIPKTNISYRLTIVKNVNAEISIEELSIDHLEKFQEFILSTLDNTEVLLEELAEICK